MSFLFPFPLPRPPFPSFHPSLSFLPFPPFLSFLYYIGQSYLGLTQLAALSSCPPSLKISFVVSPLSLFRDSLIQDGVFNLQWFIFYMNVLSRNVLARN